MKRDRASGELGNWNWQERGSRLPPSNVVSRREGEFEIHCMDWSVSWTVAKQHGSSLKQFHQKSYVCTKRNSSFAFGRKMSEIILPSDLPLLLRTVRSRTKRSTSTDT
jgi:hypothetical protein